MDLEDLHDRLHRARPVTPAITAALKYHVNAMSTSICKNFEELKSIVADHGSEVTRQWSSLTLEQQRELLVDIWPGIPFGHAPDIALQARLTKAPIEDTSESPAALNILLYPQLNIKDLMRPNALIIYINARAEHLPWTLASSEFHFAMYASMRTHTVQDLRNFGNPHNRDVLAIQHPSPL